MKTKDVDGGTLGTTEIEQLADVETDELGRIQSVGLKLSPDEQREQGIWSWIVQGLYTNEPMSFYACSKEDARDAWHAHHRGWGVKGAILRFSRCVVSEISLVASPGGGRLSIELETAE